MTTTTVGAEDIRRLIGVPLEAFAVVNLGWRWGYATMTIGFAAYGYSFYLFLSWLPNYLVKTMHMSILKSAGFAAILSICATVANLVVGGWLIDHLIARGHDETLVRMTVLGG